MTTLGKILAILNLVLSLGVAFLIMQTYIARTAWHSAYTERDKQAKAAAANAKAYEEQAAKDRADKIKVDQDLKAEKDARTEDKKTADSQVKDLTKKLDDETSKGKQLMANNASAQGELARRQQEVDYIKGLLVKRDDQIKTLEKQREDMQASMVEAQIASNSERERNEQLLRQNEQLTKDLQKAQQGGGTSTAAGKKNPPPEDVEGLVKAVDTRSGYVTITIGSDAGIRKGNTLEVYRLKPDPLYIGTIEIVHVTPNEAVGKAFSRLRGVIQVGDRVSSNILTKR